MRNPDKYLVLLPKLQQYHFRRLVRRGLDLQELPSLMVDAILSSDSEGKMIHFFSAGGAQMLIDAIDKVRSAMVCRLSFAHPNLITAFG